MKENKIIISLDNLINNYKTIKNKVGLDTIVAPTLKADAYGVGSIEVADILLKENCKNFCVFNTEEGVELRKKYKNKIENIYVFCPDLKSEQNKKYNLTAVIETFHQLENIGDTNFGLFFNTGMNRNGFSIKDIDKIKNITKKPKLIMSHMACSEDLNHPLSKIQIKNFEKIISFFPDKTVLKSLFATDATIKNDGFCYDLVRPGIGCVNIDINSNFKNIITVVSYVESINENKAKIPFGINNGLPEVYAKNGGFVLIKNKKYYIKKIMLNYSIIEVDDSIKINDEVILLDNNIKNIEDKTYFKNENILARELTFRFIRSAKNKCYYKINNELIDKRTRYKKYKNNKIINKKDRIETEIFDIINIYEDGFVGYGATAKVKKGDVLVSVYGGYCDGISRYLSNNGFFYICNTKCKIIGRVSMDQTTILLDEKIKNKVKIGDKAYILKKDILQNINGLKKEDIFYCLKNSRRVDNILL